MKTLTVLKMGLALALAFSINASADEYQWTQVNGAEGVKITRILKDATDREKVGFCSITNTGPDYDSPTTTCGGQKYYSSWAHFYHHTPRAVGTGYAYDGTYIDLPVGEFDCDLDSSAKKGKFLYKEKSGLPIYKQLFKALAEAKDPSTKKNLDLIAIYKLNEDSTKLEYFELYSSSGLEMINTGTPGNPIWTQRENKQFAMICDSKDKMPYIR